MHNSESRFLAQVYSSVQRIVYVACITKRQLLFSQRTTKIAIYVFQCTKAFIYTITPSWYLHMLVIIINHYRRSVYLSVHEWRKKFKHPVYWCQHVYVFIVQQALLWMRSCWQKNFIIYFVPFTTGLWTDVTCSQCTWCVYLYIYGVFDMFEFITWS